MLDPEVIALIAKKQALEQELKSFLYGAIEVREKGDKKYLYVHRREDGKNVTNFAGEYTPELFDSLGRNSVRAKAIKKEIKTIAKQLKNVKYENSKLSESVKRNIDYAKRYLVDSIYNQAVLEGVATTFADTEDIINGGKVSNVAPRDIIKIINLKHAWEFVLNESVITAEHDLALLCQINKLVEEGFYYNAGKLRDVPVRISGTKWVPPTPVESVIKEGLASILRQHDATLDIAINLILFIMRSQIFIDGNKRTAIIFANHFLISKGKGIISIPVEHTEEFKNLLISYYETNNKTEITEFLRQKCSVVL